MRSDMRARLFRGKRIDTGEWVQGGILQYGEGKHAYIVTDSVPLAKYIDVVPKTTGEYIGIKDRQGRRIFEGDIVKDQSGNIGTVRYSDYFLDWRISFYIGRDDLKDDMHSGGTRIYEWVHPEMCLEIIGNIHDTPELLKEAEG
jgi:uncharacterized phage protein (TIGR01671 family)